MPAITQSAVTLTGELTAFRAVGSSGWGFGTLTVDADRHAITGKLIGVHPGLTVQVTGVWTDTEKYGRQLRVRECTVTRAESPEGIIAWMTSTLPDIGRGRAKALVDRWGAQLWDVIEHDARALTQTPGITPARADAIRAAYLAHRSERDDMVTLRGWGLTDGQVARCVERWRTLAGAVQQIRSNPYVLSRAVYGFGFKRSDAVAMRAGVAYDSPYRIAAGLEHLLDESIGSEGHIYLPSGELRARAIKLLGAPAPAIDEALRAAIRSGEVVRRGTRIYSARLDRAEDTCAEAIAALRARGSRVAA